MRIYGHRGARGEMPENTIAGFRHAKVAGVAGIETDIALTGDFIPVLHHDPQLQDGRLIRDLNLAELPGVTTLAEALRAVPDTDWLLEIKTYPATPERSHPAAAMVEKTIRVLRDAGTAFERIYILAFDWAVIGEVQSQAAALRCICLTAPDTEAAPDLWWGSKAASGRVPDCAAAAGAYAWAPFHETLNLAQIGEAHRFGLQVIAWTVNQPADFQRLAPHVDGIITDYPGRFTAA